MGKSIRLPELLDIYLTNKKQIAIMLSFVKRTFLISLTPEVIIYIAPRANHEDKHNLIFLDQLVDNTEFSARSSKPVGSSAGRKTF